MPLWAMIVVVAVIWLLTGLVIGIVFGKIIKLHRIYLEENSVDRVTWAIRKFLNRPLSSSIRFVIIKREHYDEVTTEEAAGVPDVCVVCEEYDLAETEDARPPLAVISDRHIPLCTGHKKFVLEFAPLIEKLVEMEEETDEPPSE